MQQCLVLQDLGYNYVRHSKETHQFICTL